MQRGRSIAALGLAAAFALLPASPFAQAAGDRSDAGVDADDARTDALLGTLNLATPEPYGNLYSKRQVPNSRPQYVDPTNDQAFSPYFASTPRFSYLPTFSDQTEARQDFNLGFNKAFHFDRPFQLVPVATDIVRTHRFRAEALPAAAALV